MTQSKKNSSADFTDTVTINIDDYIDDIGNLTIDDNMIFTSDVTSDSTYTIDAGSSGTFTLTGSSDINLDWTTNTSYFEDSVSFNEITKMCKEYPSLEKVWRNFKSVYDMCKQDYEGKKKAGEIDDDIPF